MKTSIQVVVNVLFVFMMTSFIVVRNQHFRLGLFVKAWNTNSRCCRRYRRGSGASFDDHYVWEKPSFVTTIPTKVNYARGYNRFYSTISSSEEISQEIKKKKDNDENIIYNELKSLSQEIRRYDDLYYNSDKDNDNDDSNMNGSKKNTELLSDEEFDALVRREEEISQLYPNLLAAWQEESGYGIAATRAGRVGSSLSSTDSGSGGGSVVRLKRQHLHPMLSLDNVHSTDQLKAWLKRIQKAITDETNVTILTEPKLDGVSLSLRYQQKHDTKESTSKTKVYKLVWASTRGDGMQGQDVTKAVQSMNQTVIPKTISVLPSFEVDNTHPIEIRGEVVMPKTIFSNLTTYIGNHSFSNARNAASGILLRKMTDVKDDDYDGEEAVTSQQLRQLLQFYAYDLVTEGNPLLDGIQSRKWLNDWGFQIPMPVATTTLPTENITLEWNDDELSPMLSYYNSLEDFRESRNDYNDEYSAAWGDFEMDGCVHKISNLPLRQALGRSMKSPKWAVAHKFPPQAAVSKLLNVTVQVGRTGALTPVAVLEPVQVGGVSIQRATLHNFLHLQEILGDRRIPVRTPVLVRRAGDVIPQVVQRISDGRDTSGDVSGDETDETKWISLEPPTLCPACSSPVVWEETATRSANASSSAIGQVVRCGGPPLLCPPRAITSLAHAYSRDALDITGLSEARIEQLMEAELIRYPCDVFRFGEAQWNVTAELPGWGPKSCHNLRDTANRVAQNGVSLGKFIYSLGIRHVGKHSSELVASSYGSVQAFLDALDGASSWSENNDNLENKSISKEDDDEFEITPDEKNHGGPFPALQGVLGIGPVLVNSLLAFSKSEELVKAARDLAGCVRILEQPIVTESDATASSAKSDAVRTRPWEGYRVVFTGSLPDMSRSEAQEAAKMLGAKSTPGSVSKSTDLVVYGDKGGKKLDQAKAFGIQTMTAEEFIKLIKE